MDGWDESSFSFNEDGYMDIFRGFERITQQSRVEQHPLVRTSLIHLKVDAIDCSRPFNGTLSPFRAVHCEVTVNEKTFPTKLSSNSSQENNTRVFRPGRGEKRDNIWELLEYYGPTKVAFKLVEKGLFHADVLAEGFVQLGTLMRTQDRVYHARKASPLLRSNRFDGLSSAVSVSSAGSSSSSEKGKRWGIEYVLNVTSKKDSCVVGRPLPSLAGDGKFRLEHVSKDLYSAACDGLNMDTDMVLPEFKIRFRFRIINLFSCYHLDSVFCGSKFGRSSSELQVAIENGCVPLVEQLLASLAQNSLLKKSLALRNSSYHNALDIALLNGNVGMVKLLLRRCGIWCFQDTGQVNYRWYVRFASFMCHFMVQMQTCALHCAVEGRSPDCLRVTIRFLKSYAADVVGWSTVFRDMVEWKDPMAYTPLAVACSKPHTTEIIRMLLREGASVETANRVTQRTVFMHACEAGNMEAVSILLGIVKSQKEVRQERSVARTPSSTSSSTGGVPLNNMPRASYLSTLKCRPGEKDAAGVTALMLAAEGGHTAIVRILLKLHVSFLSTSFSGNGIFHFACSGGNREMCELLVEYETQQWNQYKRHIKEKSLLKSMCHRPKAMLIRNHRGLQPHQIAAEKGFPDLAEYILSSANTLYVSNVRLCFLQWGPSFNN
jgi:ankyrin repeat protein